MQKKTLLVLGILILTAAIPQESGTAIESQSAIVMAGQDLHIEGEELVSYQVSTGQYNLVFPQKFSMSIGANKYSSDKAVVWLDSLTTDFHGRVRVYYKAKVYLEGKVKVEKGGGTKLTELSETVIKKGESMAVSFDVTGEVYATAEKREIADTRGMELYSKGSSVFGEIPSGPRFVIQPGARVPELAVEKEQSSKKMLAKKSKKGGWLGGLFGGKKGKAETAEAAAGAEGQVAAGAKGTGKGDAEKLAEARAGAEAPTAAETPVATEGTIIVEAPTSTEAPAAAVPVAKVPKFRYPVNYAPVGDKPIKLESEKSPEGLDVATVTGRFHVWQKQNDKGLLLELEADNSVIFYSTGTMEAGVEKDKAEEILPKSGLRGIYMSGNVVLTEGQRTIRSDELYYDFENKKALAVNAELRNFDEKRGIPVYVRAKKIRQVAENKFSAQNVTVTSSEFYVPQLSLNATSVIVTDMSNVDKEEGKLTESSYDLEMRDVRMMLEKRTVFYWPKLRGNAARPDTPLRSLSVGKDSIWGTTIESKWYLSRLLGMKESAGVDSTFNLDYYSKRGIGTGAEIEYEKEDYYGRFIGYVINDRGEDRLGRDDSRRNLEPDGELRGRVTWENRQFLPHNWQLTTGVSYLSDENFLESYYRNEYSTGRKQETYVHLKRLQDNWALSLLGKGRINDFADEVEELPGAEFHLTGQSLLDDKLTLYTDSELAGLRQRIGDDHTIAMNEERYMFASHRSELDMPLRADPFKIVPYVAGTFGYDDRSGFQRSLVDGSNTGERGEYAAFIGEAGVRTGTQIWNVYPGAKSRFWDINQIRHIMEPHLSAAVYGESDNTVEQRDVVNMGLAQRLQTKRGTGEKQRTVDWMRLDTDFTFVSDSDSNTTNLGPDRYIWNNPAVPMRVLSAPEIFNGDLQPALHRFENWGPRRDYFSADYIWRLSDTTALLSELYYDIESNEVQQYDLGVSRLLWPNLSYYVGTRYLRRVRILDENGSNVFTFAATYVIDPRYTIMFAQQYDFKRQENLQSELWLIRRYHRMCWGLTYKNDETLDNQAVVFSIWPQGMPEIGLGSRRGMDVGTPTY